LLNVYDKLWVFGDSYTTPDYCVSPAESFWGLTASAIGANSIINCSWPGNSFDSVMHLVVSMQDEYDWDNDFFIIGIPPLERFTVFDNYKDTRYNKHTFDPGTWKSEIDEINCHCGLINLKLETVKNLVMFEDRAWTETQVLRSLFLLTTWLDTKNANYFVVNLSKPLDINNKWGPSNFVLPYCVNHNKLIGFDDTYYSVNLNVNKPADFKKHGWMGHHGPIGNNYFFEKSIKPKLEELFC
jgi:hypothetical protein